MSAVLHVLGHYPLTKCGIDATDDANGTVYSVGRDQPFRATCSHCLAALRMSNRLEEES